MGPLPERIVENSNIHERQQVEEGAVAMEPLPEPPVDQIGIQECQQVGELLKDKIDERKRRARNYLACGACIWHCRTEAVSVSGQVSMPHRCNENVIRECLHNFRCVCL